MKSNRKNAVINTLFRCSSILYLVALGILLVPMYLRYIPVELYGYWLATGNIIAWIGDFTPVGIVMQQKVGVSFGAKDYKTIGQYIGTSIVISALILVVLFIVLILLYYGAFHWLAISNHDYRNKLGDTLVFAGIGTLLTLFSFGFSGVNYGLQLFKSVGLLTLGTNVASIMATFLLLPHYGIYALGLSLLVRGILNFAGNGIILWLFMYKERISIQFSKKQTKLLFGDVWFNFFARIGNLLSKNSQLFFVTKFVAPEAAVIFKFTKTIPEISKYFIAVPAEAIMPVFSKYLGQKPELKDVKAKISKMIYYSIWGCGMIFLGFILCNRIFIKLWVGEEFYAGNVINMILVLWVVISSITSNLMYTVFALGDIRKNNVAVFIQSIFFIVMTVLMVRPWGIVGIALALVLSEIISLAYYPWSLQRYLRFEKSYLIAFLKEMGSVALTIVVLYFLAHFFDIFPKTWSGFVGFTIVCALSYIIVLCLTSRLFRKEVLYMVKYVKALMHRTIYS